MKVAIVDDEILARNVIEDYCGKIDAIEIVISTGNPLEFINYMQQHNVDLVFLDIEMPELNGMELLGTLIHSPKVILTTAYSQYALESYDYDVVDYLLKPIKLQRFLKAINKVMSATIAPANHQDGSNELEITHDGMPVHIPFESIVYIQSFGNYLKIFTDSRMFLITETLTKISAELPDYFQRTHKSYIANLKVVTKTTAKHLYFGDKEVPVSTTYKISVADKIKSL